MANSDNVLRGGLTPKKVDPAELASILSFAPFSPHVLRPAQAGPSGWSAYPDRCPDFSLAISRSDARREGAKPEILLCVEGNFSVNDSLGPSIDLPKGRSAFIPALSGTYAITGRGLLFRASVPG
jgi:mannose-6-phosphate isomerase